MQTEVERLAALELAHTIADVVSDRKAEDVLVLDIRLCTTIADYFVICSGGSPRQIKAITE
ncbi:MAG: RsfS/YbeB/iojap family protein, partial [Chloroflexi bacterium]|nr:RsfS/YbeB/iojap family protein [Chloroflexota bacterium]